MYAQFRSVESSRYLSASSSGLQFSDQPQRFIMWPQPEGGYKLSLNTSKYFRAEDDEVVLADGEDAGSVFHGFRDDRSGESVRIVTKDFAWYCEPSTGKLGLASLGSPFVVSDEMGNPYSLIQRADGSVDFLHSAGRRLGCGDTSIQPLTVQTSTQTALPDHRSHQLNEYLNDLRLKIDKVKQKYKALKKEYKIQQRNSADLRLKVELAEKDFRSQAGEEGGCIDQIMQTKHEEADLDTSFSVEHNFSVDLASTASSAPVHPLLQTLSMTTSQSAEARDTYEDEFVSTRRNRTTKRISCDRKNCQRYACLPSMFCNRHGGGHRCKIEGCSNAFDSSGVCPQHGGGRRCEFKYCGKAARSSSSFCGRHDMRQCKIEGCKKNALSNREACSRHSGDQRCQSEGCKNLAGLKSSYCKRHKGSYPEGDLPY